MASQKKLRSDIRNFLPGAEEIVIECLVAKVEEELNDACRAKKAGRRVQKSAIEKVISREELSALGLR